MLFSILIPTLVERAGKLSELLAFLNTQKTDEVEILTLLDNRELTIGEKRNKMLEMANGKFSAFVDDDDWLSDTYVADILHAIKTYKDLECVGFWGEVFFQGVYAGKMIHSIMCRDWTEDGKNYYRPPNHLNPVRTDIARRFKFRPIRSSEDHFWSVDMNKSGVLKREVFLGRTSTYTYRCGEAKKGL